jgi:hypothetical protein
MLVLDQQCDLIAHDKKVFSGVKIGPHIFKNNIMTCEISCMRMRFQNKRYIKVERWNDHKITLIGK